MDVTKEYRKSSCVVCITVQIELQQVDDIYHLIFRQKLSESETLCGCWMYTGIGAVFRTLAFRCRDSRLHFQIRLLWT